MKYSENLVVIHLSATAVYVVIGQVISVQDIRIMGIGKVPNNDFQHGTIKHRERLKSAIKQAIQQAEDEANCRIHSVWLTLSTPELKGHNSFGVVDIEHDTVETKDIVQALTKAKEKVIGSDYYVMRHCQQGIVVDDQDLMVDDAIGMYAKQIRVCYHLMSMPVTSSNNIQRLLQECDVSVDHTLFDAVSTAEYALIPEEREQGVCLIDIGYGTTSVCVYKENKLVFTACIDLGSHHVTMDISAEMHVSVSDAEFLKKYKATVDVLSVDPANFEIFKSQDGKEISINLHSLAKIIEARYSVIYQQVFQQLEDAELTSFIDRVVLSGGGSLMKDLVAFSKRELGIPVVLTNKNSAISVFNDLEPEKFQNLNQRITEKEYFTAFGALLYSKSYQFEVSENSSPEALKNEKLSLPFVSKVYDILKKFL